jgi:hypothetical protein
MGTMAIREPIGAHTRRCETTAVTINGACLTCGADADEACGLGIPEQRRAAMTRRQRLAQAERLEMQQAAEWLRAWWHA